MGTKKSFVGLEAAYTFFREHSTQLGQANESVMSVLQHQQFSSQRLSVCFSGCGDMEIVLGLVRTLKGRHALDVTLVDEHRGWLQEAVREVEACGAKQVSACASLDDACGPFDLTVAYHTMYYVSDLRQTLRSIRSRMSHDGILLTALASRSNKLKKCATKLFRLRHQKLPFWQEEDLEDALTAAGFKWKTLPMHSAINCTDTTEARTALINFLVGTLERPDPEALEVFTPYNDGLRLYVPMIDTLTVCHGS